MKMIDAAVEIDNGDLIYKQPTRLRTGGKTTTEINVTTLLTPGARRTGDTTILLDEAERAADGNCPTNPAIPADQEAARSVMQRLERRGLEPAWKVCPATDYPQNRGDRE